jgi:hypothetical protein
MRLPDDDLVYRYRPADRSHSGAITVACGLGFTALVALTVAPVPAVAVAVFATACGLVVGACR